MLLRFFILAFALSWAAWLPAALWGFEGAASRTALIVGTAGPGLAALILSAFEGRVALRELGHRLLRWRARLPVVLLALGVAPVICLGALVIDASLGGTPRPLPGRDALAALPLILAYVAIASVLPEELGWRGFALPRMLQHMGALSAGLLLGALWSVWHLPLFLWPGDFHAAIPWPAFALQSLALSVLLTWIALRTHHALPWAVAFHTVSNVSLGLLPILPQAPGDTRPLWIAAGLVSALALVAAWRLRHETVATGAEGGHHPPR